jgi:dienelactone hydrolase
MNSRSISSRALPYADDGTALTGALYWDDARPGPGLLLIHGGAGLDDHARAQARRYAALGYAVLACDMYGDGVTGNRDRVMACLLRLRDDPAALARRGAAGLAALRGCPQARPGPAAAIGFCFGGLAALTLARAGADLAAVVSMHGSLATTAPAAPGQLRARVLACHGALDPHVPMTDVAAFGAEMGAAGADWQVIVYGGAMHGFTHAHAVPGAQPGVAYHAAADERSFTAAREFLAAAIGESGAGGGVRPPGRAGEEPAARA